MSRERFSRRGQGKSQQDEVGRTIFERVNVLMKNRWKYLTPFDMFPSLKNDLFRYAMSDAEWEAFELLERNESLSNAIIYSNTVRIVNKKGGFSILVHSKDSQFVNMPLKWSSMPLTVQEQVHNWMIRSEAYRWEYNVIKDRVASLTRMCSTPGQIERTWPELLGFMPGRVIDSRLYQRGAKSPYPEHVWEEGWEKLHPKERKLKENYRPETLAWFNDALTEALILPLQKWDELPTYPEITILK